MPDSGRINRRSALLLFVPLAITLAAIIFAQRVNVYGLSHYFPLGFLLIAAIVLFAFPICRKSTPHRGRIIAALLIIYVFVLQPKEPYSAFGDRRDFLLAIAWLIPSIAGSVSLPRNGYWLCGIGCRLILFAGVALTTYNAPGSFVGAGYFETWIE